jgi:hypothetical protein
VRERLGIGLTGEPHLDWSMTIYLRIPGFFAWCDKAPAFRYVFVGPEGTWSFLTIVDGKDLWRLQLVDIDRRRLESADVAALMRRCMGREVPYTVEDTSLWVGWKLAAMLGGWGGAGLPASYDLERRPAAARAADVSLANYRRLLSAEQRAELHAATPAGEAARRAIGARLVEENEKSWHPVGVHLGYVYHPSPIVVPDGSPPPVDDTFGYRPTTFPGARAPHAWLAPDKSMLDLFGAGFVLLTFDEVSSEAIERAAASRGVPLAVHCIRNAEAAALYARPMVLVRPDGHVAWRGERAPADATALIDTVRGSAGG